MSQNVLWFNEIQLSDVETVGGKNASLGEMVRHLSEAGVDVPTGFATTADAYRRFLSQSGLSDTIYALLAKTDVDNIPSLQAAGKQIRQSIMDTPFPADLQHDIETAYATLAKQLGTDFSVAVRSSATAEDLPDASFAGQQETLLNVHGIDEVMKAIKTVFASLYNDRAISYRIHQGFTHDQVALSAGIQQMVRSDVGASGVMFTVDTESGFDQVVFITSSYGLGEMVVQGAVNPDEFYVSKVALKANKQAVIRKTRGAKAIKMIYGASATERVKTIDTTEPERFSFSITDQDAMDLARFALSIEAHYERPMDIEWAKDGHTGKLYIVQARPETVTSRQGQIMQRFELSEKSAILTEGRAIGQKIGQGKARVIAHLDEMDSVQPGDVLVTDMTDPDWEPVMKRASAIVTNRGGRTCHAAIIARELGIPAVVGCGDAMEKIKDGDLITVSCAEGDTGYVYQGALKYLVKDIDVHKMPTIPVKIMMNVGNPDCAFDFQKLPNQGVGLARLEFIINRMIGIHPKALLNYDSLNPKLKATIAPIIAGYSSPRQFYVDKIKEGVATIAAAFYPKPVIVRLSDFKSNEYAHLIGGKEYEPTEENPMIGFRGASRYVHPSFEACFALECEAMKAVREDMGFTNVEIMIPVVRTLDEANSVVNVLARHGLKRGENGLRVIMMCEVPANAILAEDFLEYFDGFSIGSNDLTQLTLALDRDSGLVSKNFDERNPAVKALIAEAIKVCRRLNKYVGICGQGPSDYPDFAAWLVQEHIGSISLNPDTVIETWLSLGKVSPE